MNDKKRKKWNKKPGRDEKRNPDAGVSLLEVIIAVSIFSITAIILLQGFVTSSRINRKSDLYLEATTMAQNLMEEIKSRSFEEVSLAFNYPFDINGDSRLNFLNPQKDRINNGLGIREILKTDDGYSSVTQYRDGLDESKVTASVISTDGGKTYKFNARKKGSNASKYYFELTNVEADHQNFDALVEFDGSKDSGYKKGTTTSVGDGKNDYLAPNISDMNSKTNALLIEKADANKDFLSERLTEWFTGYDSTNEESQQILDDVYDHSVRTLMLTIDQSAGTVKVTAKRELNPWDWIKSNYMTRLEDTSLVNSGLVIESENTVFSSEAGENMNNLFLFYSPNYNSTSSANPLDRIILNNKINDYDINFYVVKQKDKDVQDNILYKLEQQYRMELSVWEEPEQGNWNSNPSLYKAKTKLRTNLDYNIAVKTDDESDEIQSRLKVNQMSLIYKDQKRNFPPIYNNVAKKVLDFNRLDDREAEDRIYTAKVSVYKMGAAEKNFPEEDLVVTLDGAKED